MNAALLEERVLEIVQDDSYSGNVLPFLNRGVNWIAGKLTLASLEASDTVSCLDSQDSVALPSNYMHSVYHVTDSTGLVGDPRYYYEFNRFLRYHPDLTTVGFLNDVAIKGNQLYYASRSTTDLTVRFFERPTALANGGSSPDFLPEHLQEPLLTNYAAWKIFDLIEDGTEGPKKNATFYRDEFFSFLKDLEMFTINISGPNYIQDEADRIWG